MAKMQSLGQIENKSLRDRVLDSLRAAIVNGELKPGDTLVETDLAAQLGVSRAPLREAINVLNMEGLLETVPYHGTTVKQLVRKDIEELYSVRSMMEAFAIRHIIAAEEPHVETAVTKLRQICEEMQAAADANSLVDINQVDRRFHDTLIEYSQNSLLEMLWGNVTLRVQQVMSLQNQKKGDLQQITRNHVAIADAIEARDTNKAVQLIYQHIVETGDLMAENWEDTTQNDETES